MFTDINAAIEEAIWLYQQTGRHFAVYQYSGSEMTVNRKEGNHSTNAMFTTDSFGIVNTEQNKAAA